MEKRAIYAVILSIAILLLWEQLFPSRPSAPPPEPASSTSSTSPPEAADGGAASGGGSAAAAPDSENDSTAFEPVEATDERMLTVETDLAVVTLTNRGGKVVSWKLREFRDKNDALVDLVPCWQDAETRPLAFDVDAPGLSQVLNDALFEVVEDGVSTIDGRGRRVTFEWSDGRGLEARKTLTLYGDSYTADIAAEVRDRGRVVPTRIQWGPGFEASGSASARIFGLRYKNVLRFDGDSVERDSPSDVDESILTGNYRWAGIEDQYFAALLIPATERASIRAWSVERTPCPRDDPSSEDETEAPEVEETAVVAVTIPTEGGRLFVGPKDYKLLKAQSESGDRLHKAVYFSRFALLDFFARYLLLALLWIHDHVVANYGVAIVLTTFALRVLLFPLNQFSMVRMKKTQLEMQRIQPKLNALKKKYSKKKDAENRAKMNQEMMELYRKEGINPMGGIVGCLPLLIQFPILIGFYNMLTVAIELRSAPFFGWISDLSAKDPFYIFPILMGVTMFVQQKLAQTKTTDPMQRQQQTIMMFMPIVFTWICLQMPSGMVLYWFTNNVLGIGQQWLVNRHTTRLELERQKA